MSGTGRVKVKGTVVGRTVLVPSQANHAVLRQTRLGRGHVTDAWVKRSLRPAMCPFPDGTTQRSNKLPQKAEQGQAVPHPKSPRNASGGRALGLYQNVLLPRRVVLAGMSWTTSPDFSPYGAMLAPPNSPGLGRASL